MPPIRTSSMRRLTIALLAVLALWGGAAAQDAPLPNRPDSVKFAAIGDNGTGDRLQYEVAGQMRTSHAKFAYEFVIMLGDNLYGSQQPADFVQKFERP